MMDLFILGALAQGGDYMDTIRFLAGIRFPLAVVFKCGGGGGEGRGGGGRLVAFFFFVCYG